MRRITAAIATVAAVSCSGAEEPPSSPADASRGDVGRDAAPDAPRDASAPGSEGGPVDGRLPDAADGDLREARWALLSETGLFKDVSTRSVAPTHVRFAPRYALWSDGATKRRWLYLPEGTKIDTSDMDHWELPPGAMLFKEFSLDGLLLETRLIARVGTSGDDLDDYWMGAFVWRADQSDAELAEQGATDVLGTGHDVPNARQCWTCHGGERGHALGLSAVQLSGASPLSLVDAAARALLTDPPPVGTEFPVPGEGFTRDALGYLHANCGHCHNSLGIARPDTTLQLRIGVDDMQPRDTLTYTTAVGQGLDNWIRPDFTLRVAPGDPQASGLLARMQRRGNRDQMPPLATEVVDDEGVDSVRRWIESLGP